MGAAWCVSAGLTSCCSPRRAELGCARSLWEADMVHLDGPFSPHFWPCRALVAERGPCSGGAARRLEYGGLFWLCCAEAAGPLGYGWMDAQDGWMDGRSSCLSSVEQTCRASSQAVPGELSFHDNSILCLNLLLELCCSRGFPPWPSLLEPLSRCLGDLSVPPQASWPSSEPLVLAQKLRVPPL